MVSTVPMDLFYATALDSEHPPTNIVDNDETTFWMTTGLFPQEVVLQFKNPAQITRVTTITGKVKSMIAYAASNKDMTEWVEIDSTNPTSATFVAVYPSFKSTPKDNRLTSPNLPSTASKHLSSV